MHELVVARYNEELDWVARVPDPYRITIYNKGDAIGSEKIRGRVERIIPRANQGRESETFLHHMMSGCGAAGGITVFAQGDPFEHSPDFLALLDTSDRWRPVQALSCRWKAHLPPPEIVAADPADTIDGLRVRREQFSLADWGPLDFTDEGAMRTAAHYREAFGGSAHPNIASHFFGLCQLEAHAERAAAHVIGQFAYGAVFAARNDLFLSLPGRSLALMRHLMNGPAMFGYVMERLWLHLLGMEFPV